MHDRDENLGTTGDPVVDAAASQLFWDAVRRLTAQGLDDRDAIAQVFGDGDFVRRAEGILRRG